MTKTLAHYGIRDYRRAATRVTAGNRRCPGRGTARLAAGRPILIVEFSDVDADGKPLLTTPTRGLRRSGWSSWWRTDSGSVPGDAAAPMERTAYGASKPHPGMRFAPPGLQTASRRQTAADGTWVNHSMLQLRDASADRRRRCEAGQASWLCDNDCVFYLLLKLLPRGNTGVQWISTRRKSTYSQSREAQ